LATSKEEALTVIEMDADAADVFAELLTVY
jgi:hypothetical protein